MLYYPLDTFSRGGYFLGVITVSFEFLSPNNLVIVAFYVLNLSLTAHLGIVSIFQQIHIVFILS